MKTILNKAIILLSIIFVMSSCKSDDMNFTDVNVSPVNKLYEPANGKTVQLNADASLFFEWEASRAEDSGSPLYEVVFDKEGGDFSNPVYKVLAQTGGVANYANITHKVMNKIAGYAGVKPGESGTLIWSVAASRGLNSVLAKEIREITVTRLSGFEEIPDQVFITGEASEGGADLATAVPFQLVNAGEYEIYTKLTSGKTYQFVDAKTGTPRTFYVEGNKLREDGSSTANETAVYRIYLDYTTGTAEFTKITSLGLFFSPSNSVTMNLDYVGKGIWTGQGKITFKDEGSWKDERYKFQMGTVNASGSSGIVQWGTKIGTDSRPNSSSDPSYFYMKQVPMDQWNDKWKFATEMDGANVSISVYLQGDKQYTHSVTKLN